MLESLHSCDRQNGKPQHKMHGNVFTEWVTGACDYNAQPHPPHFPFPSCYLPYGIPLIIIIVSDTGPPGIVFFTTMKRGPFQSRFHARHNA
jgi:hypothetical protein